jgi:N-acetylneuraminic acid mutarotase
MSLKGTKLTAIQAPGGGNPYKGGNEMSVLRRKVEYFVFAVLALGLLPLVSTAISIPMGDWIEESQYPVIAVPVGATTMGGAVYVFGVDSTTTLATTEIYNPATNTWSSTSGMPTPRVASGVASIGTVSYVVGGQTNVAEVGTVEAFDASTNAWSLLTSLPEARERLALVAVNGKLYALGGCLTYTCGGSFTGLVEEFDPTTQVWTAKTSMPTPRRDFAAGVVNGIVYVVGGLQGPCCGTPILSSVEAYDPSSDTWAEVAPLPVGRESHAIGALNGIIYAVGGNIGSLQGEPGTGGDEQYGTNTVVAFDPVANTWTAVPSMPTGRSDLAVASTDNVLYAIGGSTATGETQVSEAYTIPYNVCALYDQTKAVHSGAVIPIKMYLCDASGNDVSETSIVAHATSVTVVSANAPGSLEDAGNANPDDDFRFDSTLGPSGGYIFNLQTSGMSGTYNLNFVAGSDPTTHNLQFEVK